VDSPAKCLRCSAPFLDGDQAIFDHGEWIHARCHRLLGGAEHVRKSHEVIAQARNMLAESLERVRRAQEVIDKLRACVICHRALTLAELVVAEEGLVHRACVAPD